MCNLRFRLQPKPHMLAQPLQLLLRFRMCDAPPLCGSCKLNLKACVSGCGSAGWVSREPSRGSSSSGGGSSAAGYVDQ